MNKLFPEVICFGEILWDILPSGTVAGGAPMNVAYHLQQHHKQAALITKIGGDAAGRQLLELISAKQINTQYFQTDQEHSTGKVYGTQDREGNMQYEIVQPVAWDFIENREDLNEPVSKAVYFVYGSLAARSRQSKNTLFELLEVANKKVLDINLRAPHYDKQTLLELLRKADILKMNHEELALVAAWFSGHTKMEDQIRVISDHLKLSTMIITKGGDGACLYINGQWYDHPGIKVKVADTVGSGDAFLAGLLSGLLDRSPAAAALEHACKLGAFIATQTGAMPDYRLDEI